MQESSNRQLDPVLVYPVLGWLSLEIIRVSLLLCLGLTLLGLAWHSGGAEFYLLSLSLELLMSF